MNIFLSDLQHYTGKFHMVFAPSTFSNMQSFKSGTLAIQGENNSDPTLQSPGCWRRFGFSSCPWSTIRRLKVASQHGCQRACWLNFRCRCWSQNTVTHTCLLKAPLVPRPNNGKKSRTWVSGSKECGKPIDYSTF